MYGGDERRKMKIREERGERERGCQGGVATG